MKNDSQPSHETLARLIPLACGLGGMALLWLAQPPLAWWPLAWIAPLPWLWLVTRSELPGDRPYRMLWLAGVAYWLAMLNWIPMAHPLQYVNWLLLSGYLGVYLPLFVRVSRVAVHRLGVPLWVVAPVAWVACDYAMAHVITGISMATPAHSQLPWLAVVQCVDWAGQYTLAFVMMLVAAAVGAALFARGWSRYAGLPVAAATMVAVLGYGYAKLGEEVAGNRPTVRMALVQGNEPAVWEADPDRDRRVVAQYRQLTQQAIATANAAGQPIDFVLWPECMFRDVLFTYEAAARNDPEHPVAQYEAQSQLPLRAMASETGANLIVGLDRTRVLSLDESLPLRERMQFHNSAAIVDRSGRLVDVFDKYHLVLMGEYLPFADWFPWVYEITPMALGLTPGAGPVAPEVEGVRIAPNICYESVLPHVVRRQVAALAARGERPDVLANLTNDSWFGDSHELDLHLACNRMRAVELRTPVVVAANGGLSAHIDRCGRLLAVSGKQTAETLIVDVAPGYGRSLYLAIGDWPAIGCLVVAMSLLLFGVFERRTLNSGSREKLQNQ